MIDRQDRFLLTTFAVGHGVNDWVGGTIWLIAPAIAASMGLGPAEVGLILAINGLGAGLTYIPAGIATDRFKHQGWLLLITFWWVAIGYYGATLAPGFWPVTLLLALGVMGDAFWHPVATGVLVKRMPTRRAQVLGIHAMGGSIGAEVLGPLTTGFLLGYMDWRSALQLLVIPAVIMGIAFIPVARRVGQTAQRRLSRADLGALATHWHSTGGYTLVLLMVFYNMSLMAILAMTPLFLMTNHGFTPLAAGIVFAVMVLIGTFIQPFLGKRSDIIGRKPIVVGALVFSAVCLLGAALATGLAVFLGFLITAATVLTAVRPVVLAAAVEFSGQSEATTLGIVFAALDGVGALGALFAGWIGEIQLTHAYLLAAGFALAASLIALPLTLQPAAQSAPVPDAPAATD